MSRAVLYVAVTNHGFGHAVRAASVVAEIQKQNPDILIILVTTAPRWLLESYIPGDFIHRPRAFDVGVIQADSLQMDRSATLVKLREIQQYQNSIIAGEVKFIHQNKVGLVLADIPPLAAPIAKTAGIPGWMMSNFGWDFIYRDWGGEFVEIADWIGECFSQCDRLFRLPFYESLSAFPVIQDVGLTGGTPAFNLDDLRSKFGINSPPEKTVLLTFGGLGLAGIPYDNLKLFPDWQFITFDRQAPDLPNLIKVTEHQYRPVDFMLLCGRAISKPGYSTFAEAIRLGTPLISLSREGFAEAPLLLEGLQNYGYHQILTPLEFTEGNWEFLHQPLLPPRQSEPIDKNGSESIATEVVKYFQSIS